MSNLVEQQSISLEEIIQGTAYLIPPAWQYPAITCAQITLERDEFHTENFEETKWKLERDIIVHGERKGAVKVCYLEERPVCDKGPFLKEEGSLLNAITERLGRIIERKKAEDALQVSEKRFRNLVENSPIGISIVQDNQVVYQNREQERFLGPLPRSYLLGDIESIHPDDVEKVKQVNQSISSEDFETIDLDFRFYTTDSTDSRDMRWAYCRLMPIEYHGEEAILVNIMDLTKAKELEHLLIIQDKMASLGRVAAGIAHEIRNPLSGINIYINTLQKLYDRPEEQEKVKEIFKHLQSASGKIESVIRRVMDFSKPAEPRFVFDNINRSIEDAVKLTSVTLRKSGIKLQTTLAKDLPKCRMDPQLVEEVILNLITNAADAMKKTDGEKKIRVASSVRHDHITVRILDSGPGVPMQFREAIFDPFYTTKPDSTGIGLSICHRIVTDHGGSISVHTSQWGGAEFIIEIPIKKR
jgi:PAS domain S-box-containing protein